MDEINYDKLEKSIASLERAINEYHINPSEFVQDSCIKRFEICLDTCWKYMKKYMSDIMGVTKLPNSPHPIFREACANQIIEDAEIWIEFNEKRRDSSHDYSEQKADYSFDIIDDFIKEAKVLLNFMLSNNE